MKILSDGSDLKGVQKTEDILYMKILRKSMWVIDAWPKGPNESQRYRYFMTLQEICVLSTSFTYLRINTGKLSSFEIGHTYITFLMTVIGLSRAIMVCSEKYNRLIFYFVNEMHLFHYRNKSEYSYKIHVLIHKISHFFTVYILSEMFFGLTLFNAIPIYNNYSNGMYRDAKPENATFDHSVFYAFPFDYTTNSIGYIPVFIFNWYRSYTCSTYFCVVDLTLSLLVFHLWGHSRIIIYNLENFPKPASLLIESKEDKDDEKEHKYTEQESKEVHNILRENIHYHSVIIDFQARVSHGFGEVLLLYFLFHQVSECLLMLECSQMDQKALLRFGPLTVVIFQQLIQLSIIFELLRFSNDKLIDAIYCLPWEYLDTQNRKLVFVMLRQSQQFVNLKAMNMLTVGVQTMITILKTSFSYFLMLRTVAEKDQ